MYEPIQQMIEFFSSSAKYKCYIGGRRVGRSYAEKLFLEQRRILMSGLIEAINEAIEDCQDTRDKNNNDNNYAACSWLYALLDNYVGEYKSITLKIIDAPPDEFRKIPIKHVGNYYEDVYMVYNSGKVLNLNDVVGVVENEQSKTGGQ